MSEDPDGFRALREYRVTLPDGVIADIAFVLCDLAQDTSSSQFAREQKARAYGLISILGPVDAPEYPIIWLQHPDHIALTLSDEDADLSADLKLVITRYLPLFFAEVAPLAPELARLKLKPSVPEATIH
ncbi:hypothetical protein SAMN02745126_02908 [Enhydrobacter aerosaccus]|uniref:Uncharacterized protein n=1 Tax=Enhydrobacter aerosaccus TaxID=225324 RepID=A0A1T4PMB5_9HYPH|nr:hypothetical protein [Enhydrobacter aerosaccus]SJZ92734.1 hypothetical protein SAMN02745126_02908 [Enhydrobacter aerosaccus]